MLDPRNGLLVLAAVVMLGGCGKDEPTQPQGNGRTGDDTTSPQIQEDINRGKAFLELEEYDKAADAFVEALLKEPDSDVAHYYLALTYARWGKGEQAVSEYKKLLTLNSARADDEELRYWIAAFLGIDPYHTKPLTSNLDASFCSFSPDGAHIVFLTGAWSANPQIWLMASDGSGQRKLADGEAPCFSPDGAEIAFSGGEYNSEIGVMAADGSAQRKLADGYHPSFSPDGARILFVHYARGGQAPEIHVMARDGSGQRKLADGFDPCFSPDGAQIAFAREGASYYDWDKQIWVMASDGSGQGKLADGEEFHFSPDGGQIVFERCWEDAPDDIRVMASDGSSQRKLTEGWDPSFSPDGEHILYICALDDSTTDEAHLELMTSLGSNRRRLTFGPGRWYEPSFSPDGSRVVFSSSDNYYPYSSSINGLDLTKLIGRAELAQALGVQ